MDQKEKGKLYRGLTSEQVQEKIAAGLVNGDMEVKTKSYQQILKDNLFSLFNLVNVILLICVLISGSLKNALFFLVVIWNFLIGTIQEIRAKKTIEKLSLLSAPKAYVIRDGSLQEITVRDIVLGDCMLLRSGNQICADAVVLEGSCQVNESLITGESDPVYKTIGDHLISGSFLISGHITAEVEHIGSDNYVNKITESAKYYKKPDSVIIRSVRSVVRIIAIALLPLAALLVWNNLFRLDLDLSVALIKIVASVSSMIPGGMVLLVSIVLAVSVVRLSFHKTLAKDLYSVENLARVDMLLLDKTGTITEGIMKVEDLCILSDKFTGLKISDDLRIEGAKEQVLGLLRIYFTVSEDDNATSAAIREYVFNSDNMILPELILERDIVISIPFSSETKWALSGVPGKAVFILGAPEFVLGDQFPSYSDLVNSYAENGKRAVLFAVSKGEDLINYREDAKQDQVLPEHIVPLALVILSDHVRKNAPETLAFFAKEGVTIKVISGDLPVTVSRIANEAGLMDANRMIDASMIRDDKQLYEEAEKYTVFGRVSPYQKLQLVKALKEKGHVVAMTGDGANDVLALKEADCSIAMQSGSDAARNAANIVLLDSDFSSLPVVLAEGRKSINNLQRSTGLYLTKTVYSFIFAILFLFTTEILYPFENIQITLIGAVTIGIPSFFLALEPRIDRIRDHFLRNVFLIAIPTGVLEAIGLITALSIFKYNLALNDTACSTAATYIMMLMGIIAIFNICGKLNLWKVLLILLLVLAGAGAVLIFPGLFSLEILSWNTWKVILLTVAVFAVVHAGIVRGVIPAFDKKSKK